MKKIIKLKENFYLFIYFFNILASERKFERKKKKNFPGKVKKKKKKNCEIDGSCGGCGRRLGFGLIDEAMAMRWFEEKEWRLDRWRRRVSAMR